MDKMDELEGSTVQCITEHPGFATVRLDALVLQTAYTSIVSIMETVELIQSQFMSKAILP